jgi:class 3 adenylate cyclase
MTASGARSVLFAAGALFFFGSLSVALFLVGVSDIPGANKPGIAGIGAVGFVSSAALFATRWMSAAVLERSVPWLCTLGFATGAGAVSLSVIFFGSEFGGSAVFFVEISVLSFITLRRRWAIPLNVFVMAVYALTLVVVAPVAAEQYFINVLATAVASGVILGGITTGLDDSGREEARAKAALRRFVSKEVADVVVSKGAEEMLAPHQCEVAVLFVDLRGFTDFTNNVAPEHIVHVLGEYYAAVGEILQDNGATIGGFDGDGVMAFIGDPVPHDKPAQDAVRIAKAIAKRLDPLVAEWSVDDHRLGYGIGVAFGVATLGVVGFEGRSDYTAVGAVVNLASRLCANAAPGEIVIDEAIREAAGVTRVTARPPEQLKGFGRVPTYLLTT